MIIISAKKKKDGKPSFIERAGSKIPDPVMIFIALYIIVLLITAVFGGKTFGMTSADGTGVSYEIRNMLTAENIRWIFSNAILDNWLAYAGGIVGTILIVMFGIGIAEESGLLSVLIRRAGANISDKYLPFVLILLGILSNIATDAGYIILIPLAGLLYVGIGKNPLIGMAAAFAGVSAGFSANLIPATVVDVIIGTNAEAFAQSQNIPFVSYLGKTINPMTMHYYFMVASTVMLVLIGGFVTLKFIKPKLDSRKYVIPDDINIKAFEVTGKEKKALLWAGAGFLLSLIITAALGFGPLKSYIDEAGKEVTPFLDNIILIITLIFLLPGLFYGFAAGKFKTGSDAVKAMSNQIGTMGYAIVLTFFCYNFLSLLTYTNIGNYITYIGAKGLEAIGAANMPVLLIIGFILITAFINLFVGGLSAKWMLLGPIFVPMLYRVNSSMTPDVVAAAYRIADSSTNIITPLMTYSGVVLMYMRKYKPELTMGNLLSLMVPYSAVFMVSWTILLMLFILFKIPLGF
ncbi:MAG: AbgT family transporter [Firmicutes bacterium]|nr:AbgT family transporter [Bacillota bacterium]